MTRKEAINILIRLPLLRMCTRDPIDKVSDALNMAIETLEERPHGEWIRYTEDGFDYAKCSACKWDSGEAFEYAIDRFPFCPNCGADMRKEGEPFLIGYTGEPCTNCGRYRVEKWSDGLRICEKCGFCIEKNDFYDRDKDFEYPKEGESGSH